MSMIACGVIVFGTACSQMSSQSMQTEPHAIATSLIQAPNVLPLSDQTNTGEWIYNTDVSDEFEGDEVNEDRWFIVGKFEDGKPVYKHPDKPNKRVWKGRAPSPFSGKNYRFNNFKITSF